MYIGFKTLKNLNIFIQLMKRYKFHYLKIIIKYTNILLHKLHYKSY